MTEHERIWLEPAGAPDRCWCQDNQWGDEGVEYVLASTLESLQRENEELRRDLSHEASHRQKLQNALAYWMPGVTEEIEISTNGRCGDDALLLVGYEGEFEDKCWGNEVLARAEAAEAELKRLRETPDYCYDPENWEYTCHWADRDEVHGFGESIKFGEPMKVNTLINGPTKWVADVPLTRDEEGFPNETEIQWFDSEEAARAALASTGCEHNAE